MILRDYKVQLDVNNKQQTLLLQHIGCDRWGCSVQRLLAVIQKYVEVDRRQFEGFRLVLMFSGLSILLKSRGCLMLVMVILL